MPRPHDHEKWFKKRQAKCNAREKDNEGRREKRQKGRDSNVKGDDKVVNTLNPANSLQASLVTKFSMNPYDADKIFQYP